MIDVSRLRRIQQPFRRRTPPGAMPGTVAVDPQAPAPSIRVLGYGPDGFQDTQLDQLEQLPEHLGQYPVTWVNVDGLGDARTIRRLGEIFNLHPLALEDVVNVHQRAKVDDYEDHIFVVARMIIPETRAETEQISLFLGQGFLLTFQERAGDCLETVRDRIRHGRGRIRHLGADYLLYSVLDAVIDGYFPVLEQCAAILDELDEEVLDRPDQRTIKRIHEVRSDLLHLRRAAWPHRDAINTLIRGTYATIAEETDLYLRDCYDHVVQIIDVTETYREVCADLREFYFSFINHRANEVMRLLTIIATIFIPLSFIASVYGMNFDTNVSRWNMPELEWAFGYPFALGLMAILAGGLLVYFWRKGWLGAASDE